MTLPKGNPVVRTLLRKNYVLYTILMIKADSIRFT